MGARDGVICKRIEYVAPLANTQDREWFGTGVGSEGRVGVPERYRCMGGAGVVVVDGAPRWGIRRVAGAV